MNLDDLRTYLLSKPAVNSLVTARISVGVLNQRTLLPAITLEEISLVAAESLEINSTPQVSWSRIEIDCYGSTYSEAYAVAEAVRRAPMQQYAGLMGGTTVQSVFLDDENTYQDPAREGSSEYRYVISQDWRIAYVTAEVNQP